MTQEGRGMSKQLCGGICCRLSHAVLLALKPLKRHVLFAASKSPLQHGCNASLEVGGVSRTVPVALKAGVSHVSLSSPSWR